MTFLTLLHLLKTGNGFVMGILTWKLLVIKSDSARSPCLKDISESLALTSEFWILSLGDFFREKKKIPNKPQILFIPLKPFLPLKWNFKVIEVWCLRAFQTCEWGWSTIHPILKGIQNRPKELHPGDFHSFPLNGQRGVRGESSVGKCLFSWVMTHESGLTA